MLRLKDIREYISSLSVTTDDKVYIGKLDNKQQQSIGIYNRKTDGKPQIALGGSECTTYCIKPISLLIHWSKNVNESEQAAYELYDKLIVANKVIIGDSDVNYLCLMVPEPQNIGTDDNGVHEYVIWLDFVYRKE